MVFEIGIGCLTLVILALIIMRGIRVPGGVRKRPISPPGARADPEFAKIDDLTKLKSLTETRIKCLETEWDDMYKKLRRKEARAYRDDQKAGEVVEEGKPEPGPVTGEDLHRAFNRQRFGISG